MQLARRGGHRSGRKIRPEQVDGYLQAIRDSMMQEESGKRKPPVLPKKGAPPPIPVHGNPPVQGEQLKLVDKPDLSPTRVAFQPKGAAVSQPKAVFDGKKGVSKGDASGTVLQTKAVFDGMKGVSKGDASKNTPKLVWKPKSRAAGQTELKSVQECPLLVDDPPVRRFESEKYLRPEDAALLAVQRAVDLQSELRPELVARGTCGSEANLRAEQPHAEAKSDAKQLHLIYPTMADENVISTMNPCKGESRYRLLLRGRIWRVCGAKR